MQRNHCKEKKALYQADRIHVLDTGRHDIHERIIRVRPLHIAAESDIGPFTFHCEQILYDIIVAAFYGMEELSIIVAGVAVDVEASESSAGID